MIADEEKLCIVVVLAYMVLYGGGRCSDLFIALIIHSVYIIHGFEYIMNIIIPQCISLQMITCCLYYQAKAQDWVG